MSKKKRLEPVTFSLHEKMALGLPISQKKFDKPEDLALRKIVDMFPEVLVVAECRFDQKVAAAATCAMAARLAVDREIHDYAIRKKAERDANE